jgi:hypothetical protein
MVARKKYPTYENLSRNASKNTNSQGGKIPKMDRNKRD